MQSSRFPPLLLRLFTRIDFENTKQWKKSFEFFHWSRYDTSCSTKRHRLINCYYFESILLHCLENGQERKFNYRHGSLNGQLNSTQHEWIINNHPSGIDEDCMKLTLMAHSSDIIDLTIWSILHKSFKLANSIRHERLPNMNSLLGSHLFVSNQWNKI